MSDKLKPETAARLLRAKAAELEQLVLDDHEGPHQRLDRVSDLTADVALLFSLLADVTERQANSYAALGPLVPIGDPLFNEDGTPWTAEP